jgi:hypothetical protein
MHSVVRVLWKLETRLRAHQGGKTRLSPYHLLQRYVDFVAVRVLLAPDIVSKNLIILWGEEDAPSWLRPASQGLVW